MSARIKLSPEANETYLYLKKRYLVSKKERTIFKAIHQKADIIKTNTHYGNPIPKRLIPKEYILKYNIKNLYRVELPSFWQMLYSLTNDEIKIIAFVLDMLDHKRYNKKFSYK